MTSQQPEKPPGLRTRVELWVVIILMGVAFAAGVLVRGAGTSTPPSQATDSSVTQAPPLSDQQLTGSLPPGHPAITQDQGVQPSSSASPKPSTSP